MLLHDLVARAALAHPDRPAVIVDDEVTTFAQLDLRTTRLAAAVEELVPPGGRVAFLAENGPEWVDAYYGVPRAGRTLGFVNHRLGQAPLRAAVERLRPTVLIAGRGQLDELRATGPLADLAPIIVDLAGPGDEGEIGYTSLLAESGKAPNTAATTEDTAWLIATSGTSGTPKVVELSHANLLAAVRATLAVRPSRHDDVYLFPFPLCHVAGYNVLLFHHEARPVVIARRFTPAELVAQVARHQVTTVSLAPTMIHALLAHVEATGDSLAPLRTISYGSSGIAPTLLAAAVTRFGTDFNQGYGMTEMAGNGVFLGPEDHRRGLAGEDRLLSSAGRPGPTVEVTLLDEEGTDVPVGSPGEIAVRAAQVMKGYWEAPDANAAAFTADGWFRTGDVGRFDTEGYLSVIDRKKDIIVSGGENISSREVEDHLVVHPGVAEVAVIGVPDERWGEVVCAVVVPTAGSDLSVQDVLAFGRAEIGGFQQPRIVVLVDALPRNGSGKVLKGELRESHLLSRP